MLEKQFDPASFEGRLYQGWEAAGAFGARPDTPAPPFTIMIPPPNVTGSLHIGHALTFTLQDTLTRWRRMQGRDALWQPGTDHAGIATQMVVERLLAAEGREDRRSLGRTRFVERVWQWKEESGGTITRQLRRLGASLDWPRERFTMDEGLSRAVREVFVTLHGQGLISRAQRLVNWDPVFQTAISDLEVESREVKGSIWHLRYPVEGEPDRALVVATTRPETLLGDVAVAVHPEDARFADLIGKHVILPLVGRRIPVIADPYSDPQKGSGAVKITPAHDFNDFEVGRRHALDAPSVMDPEARIRIAEITGALAEVPGVADPAFVRSLDGKDRFVARTEMLAELDRLGLIEKTEPHTHMVPHGDRSGVPIEPRLTLQWYCDAKTLAQPAIRAVETGETVFVPRQWENTFFAWMRDIQPWCISRQLWWGHQIPAWYAPDGEVFVARTEEEAYAAARAKYGPAVMLERDPDVLDTWFSSALWPFSTLGWPERTPELEKYYPGDVLVTGFDIIFFWVARMMMMGHHFMGAAPFRHVYIHGLVRDERGQKMSKSKGNVMDPLGLIDEFGADALRFAICALTTPGRDIKLGRQRVESYRSFCTKIWNAARFCEMNGIAPAPRFDPAACTTPLARWILDAANRAVVEATDALNAYRFDEYAAACRRFAWDTFCDWFLEFAKPVLAGEEGPEKAEAKGAAQHVLGVMLRLLHPVMPFITEEIWDRFGYGAECSLIRAEWPHPVALREAEAARAELQSLVQLISDVRELRAEYLVPPGSLLTLGWLGGPPTSQAWGEWLDRYATLIARLARVEFTGIAPVSPGEIRVSITVGDDTLLLGLGAWVEPERERARLGQALKKVDQEIVRLKAKLSNEGFLRSADVEVIEEHRDRLAAEEATRARLDASLARIA